RPRSERQRAPRPRSRSERQRAPRPRSRSERQRAPGPEASVSERPVPQRAPASARPRSERQRAPGPEASVSERPAPGPEASVSERPVPKRAPASARPRSERQRAPGPGPRSERERAPGSRPPNDRPLPRTARRSLPPLPPQQHAHPAADQREAEELPRHLHAVGRALHRGQDAAEAGGRDRSGQPDRGPDRGRGQHQRREPNIGTQAPEGEAGQRGGAVHEHPAYRIGIVILNRGGEGERDGEQPVENGKHGRGRRRRSPRLGQAYTTARGSTAPATRKSRRARPRR